MIFTDSSQSGTSANLSVLPKHILVGYWHNWDASPAAFLRLRDVVDRFDVVNIAFATCSKNGKVIFVPHGDAKQFESDVAELQRRGKKVLISIGGATGSIAIDNLVAQDHFSRSVVEIVRQYGFDGIDVNLEGSVILEDGDADFRNPTSACIRHLTTAIREIRNNFGPDFILSLAPETINVQGGFNCYERASGSYLPVIHELRDVLTYLQVQHYNSGPLPARDRNTYVPGTTDFHAAMVDMLLQGFMVQENPEQFFPPLRPDQIVIGLAAWPEAVHGGYTAPLEMKKVLDDLTRRASALRGIMTWSINWDAVHHYQFSNSLRTCLDVLP